MKKSVKNICAAPTSLIQMSDSNNSLDKAFIEDNDITLLWIHRLMVPLGGYKQQFREKDFYDDTLAEALGFQEYLSGDKPKKYNLFSVRNALFIQAKKIEENKSFFEFKDSQLATNIERLAQLVRLSEAETAIIKFIALVCIDDLLETAVNSLGNQSVKSLEKLFSVCLDLPINDVRKALQPTSKLLMSGLMIIDTHSKYEFTGKVDLLRGLVDELYLHHDNPVNILKNIISPSVFAKLDKNNYPHLANQISLITDYLNQITINKCTGVNILIYGVPGSGKTEFSRMIAQECKLELFEVASASRSDTPLDAEGRFRAYRLGQILCSGKNRPAIMFDEVEDVFVQKREDNENKSNNSGKKLWINKVLEENAVPAFWITNSIESIDPAYIRRFDFVVQINSPPKRVREKVLSDFLHDIPVSDSWKKMMAENDSLLPAVIERSAKVIRIANSDLNQVNTEQALETILGNTLEAMGFNRPSVNLVKSKLGYKLDVLNTDISLEDMCEGLSNHKQGRVCLYGPPGTGKTAFGKYLADRLDLPLISKRASDIVSPYLGDSEKNMAKMFRQAKDENAVLMLDEADTFLSDRKNAQRSWEISAINEMLTQMENFEGIFIASTNFMQSLDSASLRRFDIKIKFDYMNANQTLMMFQDLASQLNLAIDDATIRKLNKLHLITPGDFAAVKRKLYLIKAHSAENLVAMIEEECKFKSEFITQPIGFLN